MFSIEASGLPNIMKRMANPAARNQQSFPKEILADPNGTSDIDLTKSENFTNPVRNVTTMLTGTLQDIRFTSNGVIGLETIVDMAGSANTELAEFIRHTDRLSGQTQPGEEVVDRRVPYLVAVANIGKSLSYITYVVDNTVSNNRVANSFSSVMQSTSNTLNSHLTTLESDLSLIEGSIYTIDSNLYSNLSNSQVSSINSHINTFESEILTLRTNDESAFINSITEIRSSAFSFVGAIANVQAEFIANSLSNLA